MQQIETDYLIIGSGASGMAFADTLLQETQGTDTHITLVDRHAKPGGHWNDAYPFVTLHQPSAFYGVNSLDLGVNRKDAIGPNQGLYELASGPEISGYYNKVMNQTLLPSGRVSYFPMSNFLGFDDGTGLATFETILSGAKTQVKVRKKLVDANFFGPFIPSTHTPKFKVADGVKLVTPNALAQLWRQPDAERASKFCVLGAGKTAMDAGIWLLNSGAAPDSISWVMPRDSYLVNRLHTQPGMEFFNHAIGGQADLMDAFAKATSIENLFERLEACEAMLRIYPDHKPSMFHYATMSKGEVKVLRRIKTVIRMGHVHAVERSALLLAQGRVVLPEGTLCIDCTASAVERRPTLPIFNGDKLTLQMVRIPQPAFSAALVAYVEAHYEDDAAKNKLCMPVPLPDDLHSYLPATMTSMMNQFAWGQDKALRNWIHNSRLDGFGKVIAAVDPQDTQKMAILERFKASTKAAVANIPLLMTAS